MDMSSKIFGKFFDLMFPAECIFCGRPGSLLCGDCRQLFDIISIHKQYRSKKLRDLYAAASYQNRFVKSAIAKFKYEPFLQDLKIPLAETICNHLDLIENKPDFGTYSLAAVPISKKRMRWRGYNQAEELAKEISATKNIPLLRGLLEKTGNSSVPQATLLAAQRRESVKGTIKCGKPETAAGIDILLVDDVVATGATLEECADVLLKNGAKTVIGLAVARSEADS
jgi:ComF family protein